MTAGPGLAAIAWAGIAGAAALAALLAHDGSLIAVVGPAALPWLWAPPALAAASTLARDRDRGAVADATGSTGRLVAWLLALCVVADPAPNAPDLVMAWVAGVAGQLRGAVLGLGGLLLLGAVVALFVDTRPGDGEARRSKVTSGSSIGPAAATILRLALRLALWLAAAALRILILSAAWTVAGVDGARQTLAGAGDGPVTGPAGRLFAAVGGGSSLVAGWLGRASAGWGQRTTHGVWIAPAALARDAEGEVVDDTDWPAAADMAPEEVELRELACGLLAAYDVALSAPSRSSQDPRVAPPKLTPYRIEIARAWARPEYLAVVVRITPAAAATAAARLGTDALVPALDAATSLTADDLRRLRVSDRRIAADPLRDGAAGLFIALDREPTVDGAEAARRNPVEAAVARALDEAGLAARFRMERHEDGFDNDTVEFRATFRTSAEYRELESAWRGLQPAVALFARNPNVRLEAQLDPYAFLAVFPKATPEFPSGDAVALDHVLARYGAHLRRHPLRFVLGLDQRAEPLFAELGTETPHLLVAGGTGSGKSRAVFSSLTQLVAVNPPDRLGLWLLDSVKRELAGLFGDASHVERRVIAEDAGDVVGMLTDFVAAMDRRYRELDGRAFDPVRGRSHLLVLEEFADLRDLLERSELDEVVRLVNRIGQIGRGAGFHLILVTQKASAEVIPPRLKANFKGRIAGFLPQASDYGILFDQHRRLLPNIKGRLAVSLGGDEVRVVQAIYADNATIRRHVEQVVTADAAPPALGTVIAAASADLDAEPRQPSAREVELLTPLTLARVLYRWQAEERVSVLVSVRSVADRLRAQGYTPGRTERLTAVLAELESLGVLERTGESANAPRRLRASWAEVESVLATREAA